jgi:hypothetical protein
MWLHGSSSNPRALVLLGMAALAAANLFLHFAHPTPSFPESAKDGVAGFLYGVAIAAMLLGLRRRGRGSV